MNHYERPALTVIEMEYEGDAILCASGNDDSNEGEFGNGSGSPL